MNRHYISYVKQTVAWWKSCLILHFLFWLSWQSYSENHTRVDRLKLLSNKLTIPFSHKPLINACCNNNFDYILIHFKPIFRWLLIVTLLEWLILSNPHDSAFVFSSTFGLYLTYLIYLHNFPPLREQTLKLFKSSTRMLLSLTLICWIII